MKIVYIAHPLSGDLEGSLEKIRQIIRQINLTEPDILPFAHYWVECHVLDDSIIEERQRGIKNDVALLKAGFINEMWLYGDKISYGMRCEIEIARTMNIPVKAKSDGTLVDLKQYGL